MLRLPIKQVPRGSAPAHFETPEAAEDPALVALGMAISKAWLERAASQEELAHRSSIDRSYMSSVERGQQNPSIISVLRIAYALDMTAMELMAEAKL